MGTVRFLSVSPYGAVLEALGKLDYAFVPFEIPVGKSQGQYVRIAGPNDSEHLVANFECSINLDKVSAQSLLLPTICNQYVAWSHEYCVMESYPNTRVLFSRFGSSILGLYLIADAS